MPYDSYISRTSAAALIPEQIAPEIIQGAVQQSVTLSLFRRLPDMTSNQTRMPVLSSLPTAYFVNGDTGYKQTTSQAWANKYIVAEEVAAIVPVPVNVIDDAGYPIWDEVRPRLIESIAEVIDNAVFFGINAPSAWPTPVYQAAVAAGNSVALGPNDLYDSIMGDSGSIAKLEADGYIETAHIASMDMRGRLRGLRSTTGELIFNESMQGAASYFLNGSPLIFPQWPQFQSATSNVLLFSGKWNELVYAVRRDIAFSVATEAVITDPAGNVIFNLFQQDMVALRVVFRMGWQCPNPINRLRPNEADRYPVSVLTV